MNPGRSVIAYDEDSSPVGDGLASALIGQHVTQAGLIDLEVTGTGDTNFTGAHTESGAYTLYVRLGVSDFSTFDPSVFDFQFNGTLAPGQVNSFLQAQLAPGTPYVAWINNQVGSGSPDTLLGSFTNHQVDYTAAADFVGTDTFGYTVKDNNGATSNTATVTVTVLPEVLRPGFESVTFPRNDDGTYPGTFAGDQAVPQALGFSVNFYGLTFNSAYVNNNGNITFDQPLSEYTPFDLNTTARQIIAPFFADVDTRLAGQPTRFGTGTVDGHPAFGVTWREVDYFDSSPSHTNRNSFQLVLISRSDIGAGDFDFEFNYDQIQWEAGTASGGDGNGLGGSSARAGYSNGTGTAGTFFELPGSAVNGAFLDSNPTTGLIHNDRNSDLLGRYVFSVRSGIVVPPTQPTFVNLSAPTITYGAASTLISGHLDSNSSSMPVPAGETVQVTINGVTQNTTLDANDDFSTSFATGSLGVSGSPYTIGFSYAGDDHFTSATGNSTLTVQSATPTLSNLSSPSITQGTASTTISGHLNANAGTQLVPAGETIQVTLNGVTQNATLNNSDDFSTDFNTSALTTANSPYTISFSYGGDANFNTASGSSSLSISPAALATPTFSNLSTPSITYGTAATTISGHLNANAGGPLVPPGELVQITLNGVSHTAPLDGSDNFSVMFATGGLGVPGSPYTISFAYAGDSGFNPASGTSSLTVTPAPLTITADDKTMTYGGVLPTLTATFSGLVNGDTPAIFNAPPNQPPVIATVPASSHAGSYAITVSGASNPNYTITFKNGTLTIDPALLTIRADDQIITAGQDLPVLTASYLGLVNGDTPATFLVNPNVPPTLSTVAAHSPPGHYPITPGGAVDADYTISYQDGTLTILAPVNAPGMLVLLDPTSQGALADSGQGQITVAGSVVIDSSNVSAATITGQGHVTAGEIDVTGAPGVRVNGRGSVQGTIKSGQAAIPDPLAALTVPTSPSTVFAGTHLTDGAPVTLQPGTYQGGISISGHANVTLMPGVYYLQGGGLAISGFAQVQGTGVLIYNAPRSAGDVISISGQASVQLSAAGDGPDAGVVFFQDRGSTNAISITGAATVSLQGGVYAARAPVLLSGQAVVAGSGTGAVPLLVAADLRVTGQATLDLGGQAASAGVMATAQGTTSLAAVSTAGSSVVFVVTPGGSLYRHDAGGWTKLGDAIAQVSASMDASGNAVVFAVTQDHALARFDAVLGWQLLGAPGTIQSVSAGTDREGRASAFVLTTPGNFLEYRGSSGWLGTVLGAQGTILSMSAADQDRVVVVGADGSLLEFDLRVGWFALTGPGFARSASVATEASGQLAVFAVTLDHALWVHEEGRPWTKIGNSGTIQTTSAGTDQAGSGFAGVITASGAVAEFHLHSGWASVVPGDQAAGRQLSATAVDRLFLTLSDGSVSGDDSLSGLFSLAGPGFGRR